MNGVSQFSSYCVAIERDPVEFLAGVLRVDFQAVAAVTKVMLLKYGVCQCSS